MPSKSPAQARTMAAVAHGWKPPKGINIPMQVAKEFNKADKMRNAGMLSAALRKPHGPQNKFK